MSSSEPSSGPTIRASAGSTDRDYELRDLARRENLWLRANTTLLAILLGMLAFFGRDLYSDVKSHGIQLATLNERVDRLEGKVDKLAAQTEENGRTLAEIKGFLQARFSSDSQKTPRNPIVTAESYRFQRPSFRYTIPL